jgi:hypothetical protein
MGIPLLLLVFSLCAFFCIHCQISKNIALFELEAALMFTKPILNRNKKVYVYQGFIFLEGSNATYLL